MSWLRSGLSQSITGGITSLKGQLEDILTEGTDEIEDPRAEVRASLEKLKEYERQLELVKSECARWQEEAAEMGVKCQTYEAQLAQRQDEHRRLMADKQAQIESLKRSPSALQFTDTFQKSALMEDFEELVPQNEFSDYIQLQKEIKRLGEDNEHFVSENRQLLARIKQMESDGQSAAVESGEATAQDMMANTIRDLNEQIGELQRRLEAEKDRGQEAVIALQQSYKDKAREQSDENQAIRQQLAELQARLDDHSVDIKISSSKSDDGWQINDIEEESKTPADSASASASASERNEQVQALMEQLSKAEEDLDKANMLIAKLRKKEANGGKKQKAKQAAEERATQTTTLQEFNVKHEEELRAAKAGQDELEARLVEAEALARLRLEEVEAAAVALRKAQEEANQERILQAAEREQQAQQMKALALHNDQVSMQLSMMRSQTSALEERLAELTAELEQVTVREADAVLRAEQAEARVAQQKLEVDAQVDQQKQMEFVLEEKARQISQLKASVNEHLAHIEAQAKTLSGLQAELEEARSAAEAAKEPQATATETQTQTDAQTGDEKAEGKGEADGEEGGEEGGEAGGKGEAEGEEDTAKKLEELAFFKTQYNQIYAYLEQKNVESLGYYNEIQRLNLVLSDQSRQLLEAQSQNEELSGQYETLCKDFQLHQRMVEELNEQTAALNETLSDTKQSMSAHMTAEQETGRQVQQQQQQQQPDIIAVNEGALKVKEEPVEAEAKAPAEDHVEVKREPQQAEAGVEREEHERVVGELEARIAQAKRAEFEHMQVIEELEQKLAETVRNYEGMLAEAKATGQRMEEQLAAAAKDKGQADLQEQAELAQMSQKLAREMDKNEKLREHLVEMSDSYTAEAVQAEEREKQLRSALAEAERRVAESGLSLESSGREMEERLERAVERAEAADNDRKRLEAELAKSEANAAHQLKVTKNLELVLDRLQKDQDSQHAMEAKEWQRTIKEQSAQIFTLQREINNHKQEVTNLKDALNEIQILDMELKQKDDIIKQLNDRVGTKDALVESLEKRIGETQKLNNDYIEKAIIKNLVIGYIKVQQQQEKRQVIKLIGTMLDFSAHEFEQVEGAGESKWFGGLLGKPSTPQAARGTQLVTPEGSLNQSFTDLFIQYVDRESKPKPNFQFDINTSHKKTDGSPVKAQAANASGHATVLSNSPSGAFNRNMAALAPTTPSGAAAGPSPGSLSAQLASPAAANSFLEQILK